MTVSPSVRFCAGIVSVTTGSWFAASTVTSAMCEAEAPSGSVAVTVTCTWPLATAFAVTLLPETETVSTELSDEDAE
ncbi:MAG: hypothetical protein F4Y21_08535 [Gemmatimonadetes bacterium]|nr:hypothetical protein [Gemmatimonadota bacterium]